MRGVLFGFIGIVSGGLVGGIIGAAGWIFLFYLIVMVPDGVPFNTMDQGAIPAAITGPLGALVGALVGAWLGLRYSRRGAQKLT
jgi:hypothetical protein